MDTQNIRSHLLKDRLSKWTLTLSFLIGRSFCIYDSLYSRACHFLQMPEEADRVPSGIWDISRSLSCLEDAAP